MSHRIRVLKLNLKPKELVTPRTIQEESCQNQLPLEQIKQAVQRKIGAPAWSGRPALGDSGVPAGGFGSGPGSGWRPGTDWPVVRGCALLGRGGETLSWGAVRAPGGLPVRLDLPSQLGCSPWPLLVGVLPRRWQLGTGASRLSCPTGESGARGGVPTLAGALGEASGPLEVNPGARGDCPREGNAAVKSGAAAPRGAPAAGLGLGPGACLTCC
ncbi:hypothetical protein NDU88_006272 [Pleurodeles waltl]|uniref:Uncharacterized protein n=1 Tax=Pleurodeles waltl TaxID=8319 RepID=A0AAV7SP96_PLEWA|nr:hypothetical protein NDU88_006272 [Pleurodeles waltl]